MTRFFLILFLTFSVHISIVDAQYDTTVELPSINEVEFRFLDSVAIKGYLNQPDFDYGSIAQYDETLWSRFKRWVRRQLSKIFDEGGPIGFKILVYGLILLVLGALVYVLARSETSTLFRKRDRRRKLHADILDESIEISRIDELLQSAKVNRDFRSAVRLLYIQTLFQLEKQELLELEKSKTVHHYIQEFPLPDLKQMFVKMTSDFEYVWYGEYDVDDRGFGKIEQNITDFQKAVRTMQS